MPIRELCNANSGTLQCQFGNFAMPIRERYFFHKFEIFLGRVRRIDHKVFWVDSIYRIESTGTAAATLAGQRSDDRPAPPWGMSWR